MVPYIASQGTMKGRIRAISRHMEGQESYESDPSQGKLQNVLDYAHIPMYATIEVISVYVRGYRGKSRVYQYCNVFLGMIKVASKDIKWSKGANESAVGQGKAIQCVIHLEG